jgi:hypothetical protein
MNLKFIDSPDIFPRVCQDSLRFNGVGVYVRVRLIVLRYLPKMDAEVMQCAGGSVTEI